MNAAVVLRLAMDRVYRLWWKGQLVALMHLAFGMRHKRSQRNPGKARGADAGRESPKASKVRNVRIHGLSRKIRLGSSEFVSQGFISGWTFPRRPDQPPCHVGGEQRPLRLLPDPRLYAICRKRL